ncbi:MAG: T9SS type A sorting domain-containing protein [Crocinitomix sp.]|nr:T9SS type A sorting domain-containing protein [Crocinitomix sp.]
MKKFLLIFFSLQTIISFTQNDNVDWQVEPFSNIGFAENLDRYDGLLNEEVQFFADYGPCKIYLSDDAFIFGKPEDFTKEEVHERYEKIEHNEELTPAKWSYFKIEFQNTNALSTIEATEINRHTLHFQDPENSEKTLMAKTYKALIYKNIYPNIDMKLELPEEGGLKYSFYVHPGGDYTSIRMKYSGAEVKLLESGELKINASDFGFKDAKPVSEVDGNRLNSNYRLENNEVTFDVENYDVTQTLVIDPWLVTDVPFDLSAWDKKRDVAYDDAGRCVISGGSSIASFERKVAQYNSEGELNWLYDELYGGEVDITTIPSTGYIYALAYWYPGRIDKLNMFGVLFAGYEFHVTELALSPVESRAIKYNDVYNKLCIGHGGLYGDSIPLIGNMDPDLLTWDTHEVLIEDESIAKDPIMFDIDPDGESIYFAVANTYGGWHSFSNKIYKVDFNDPDLIYWENNSGYILDEAYNFNGMACGKDFLFTVHGDKLKRWDKETGLQLDSLVFDDPYSAGIDTDDCGNVYVGFKDSIVMYNSDLTQITMFEIPDSCTDISINKNLMYACGPSFLTKINLAEFNIELTATADNCESCNGTATIDTTNDCHGYEVESILWSPGGQTTFTATGLCAGWYETSILWVSELGDSVIKVDSIEVILNEESVFTLDLGDDTTICKEAIFMLDAGSDNSSFSWQDGSTEQFYTVDTSGTYWVEAEDQYGCILGDSIEINVISCLSINEFDPSLVEVFPNPFDDFTTINFGQEMLDKHIVVYDSSGKIVYRKEILSKKTVRIEKERLAVGIYVLSIINNSNKEEVFTVKLLVE